jgi:lysylphosphatidylglycerol synthetase-like protein (DUF2156 family)
MTLQEEITLQRYRYVQERANYFADLARHTFGGYLIFFVTLMLAACATMVMKEAWAMKEITWIATLMVLAATQSVVAIASAAQIFFCVGRWKNFRRAECEINADTPQMNPMGMSFNVVLITLILLCLAVMWGYVLYLLMNYPSNLG